MREAIAWALAGDTLRRASARVGYRHPSTLHEALEALELAEAAKAAQVRRAGGLERVRPMHRHLFDQKAG